MAHDPVKRYWTLEEYLEYEQETGIKHEFIDGEIYAMSGGTDKHSLIAMYTGAELIQRLRGKSCRTYNSDMRVKITDTTYVYPDFSVVCGKAEFADEKHTMLLNPTLVAGVISSSSADYDRGSKADFYRSLASVQAYLLLDQDRVFAQLYTRHEAAWLLQEFSGLEALIPLEAINCSLPLSEAYRDIEFDD
jgi:Uma2 family endonuclease